MRTRSSDDVSLLGDLPLVVLGTNGVQVVSVLGEICSEALVFLGDVVLADVGEGKGDDGADEAQGRGDVEGVLAAEGGVAAAEGDDVGEDVAWVIMLEGDRGVVGG